MDAYVAWNTSLLRAFFSAASAGEETWLAVDLEELDAIGPHLGGTTGFLEAVRRGPPWRTIPGRRSQHLYESQGTTRDFGTRALGLMRQRQNHGLRPVGYVDPGEVDVEYTGENAPTYLPILAALVLAGADQDEAGYYRSLRAKVGLEEGWGSIDMRAILPLWQDLADWTEGTNGAFGRFYFRQLGGFRLIGLPRSQSIISRRDAQMLTRVFAQAGVRPGQPISARLLQDLKSVAASVPYLSSAFRDALARADYGEPIEERLRALLDDWDGEVVSEPTAVPAGRRDNTAEGDLRVALSLSTGNELPWRVRWQLPGLSGESAVVLRHDAHTWPARFAGEESTLTNVVEPDVTRELLTRSASEDVAFDVTLRDESGADRSGSSRLLLLRRMPLRVLVEDDSISWSGDVATLVEHALPANGGAYLLVAPANVSLVRTFLRRNEVHSADCPHDGLPDGWLLLRVDDCAAIGEAQRNELPDGLDGHTRVQPRVVRLIGGCQLRRAGVRQYLPYDLPGVELDAPHGTVLHAPGLRLHERARPVPSMLGFRLAAVALGRGSSLQRFDVEVVDPQLRSFDIVAVHRDCLLGTVRLRIAPEDGLAIAPGAEFALDSQGSPTYGADGLRGAVLAEDLAEAPTRQVASTGDLTVTTLGAAMRATDIESIRELASAELLDALAQRGSLAYGVARDMLARLTARGGVGGRREVHEVFSELRSRGLLEIEADAKGRWLRLHATPRVICLVPSKTPDGCVVATLSGTMRLQDWTALRAAEAHGVFVRGDVTSDPVLPALRLVSRSAKDLQAFAAANRFGIADRPAVAIARWAASLDEVRGALERHGVELFESAEQQVERYVPRNGTFVDGGRRPFLSSGARHELFRLDDLETGRHKLYSLGFRDAHRTPRYAFVADSRWGIWAALVAFGKLFQDQFGIADASPWPFEYSRQDDTLWIPARISFPVVLERALVLCSGERPFRLQVHRGISTVSLIVERRDRQGAIGGVSHVYHEFVPERDRWATWLGYRWVPEDVARLVADRLGGQLRYIDE